MSYLGDHEINTHEFECPNCGERVYTEVLVCPNCGLHFFEEDTAGPLPVTAALASSTNHPSAPGTLRRAARLLSLSPPARALVGIIAGLVISAGTLFIVHLAAGRFWTPPALALPAQLALLIAGPVGVLMGGYTAAYLSGSGSPSHLAGSLLVGAAVALFGLAAAYLLQSIWQIKPTGMPALAGWVLILLAGPVGGWLAHQAAAHSEESVARGRDFRLYLELLAYVRHDINIAERLIELERRRTPTASRARLIKNAITRLKRGRH